MNKKSLLIAKCVKHHQRLLLTCFFTCFSILSSPAQNAIQFSQYFSNQLVLNPAYAGSDDALSLTMVHRNQWSGVNGAPVTMTFSGHTLFKNKHTGLGISLFTDKINIHRNFSFTGIYSYRIKTGANSYLSLGLQAGVNHVRSDYASLLDNANAANDPYIVSENISESAFQFGSGVYFKSRKIEIGLSSPVFYSSGFQVVSDSLDRPIVEPHYFLYTRLKFQVSPYVRLNPGVLLKKKPGGVLSYDINIDAWVKEVLMAGLSYRSHETLGTIMQMKVLPQMKVGYAYDIPLSSLQRRHYNSHEFMLNYIFHYKNYNIDNPR